MVGPNIETIEIGLVEFGLFDGEHVRRMGAVSQSINAGVLHRLLNGVYLASDRAPFVSIAVERTKLTGPRAMRENGFADHLRQRGVERIIAGSQRHLSDADIVGNIPDGLRGLTGCLRCKRRQDGCGGLERHSINRQGLSPLFVRFCGGVRPAKIVQHGVCTRVNGGLRVAHIVKHGVV